MSQKWLKTFVLWKVKVIWFGLVLWYINHGKLFNAKSSMHIYIKYMISKHILQITFLNETKLIWGRGHSWLVSLISVKYEWFYLWLNVCWHRVKCFQVLLFNTNNSIKHQLFFTHSWIIKRLYSKQFNLA